jgi:hypothetical protein
VSSPKADFLIFVPKTATIKELTKGKKMRITAMFHVLLAAWLTVTSLALPKTTNPLDAALTSTTPLPQLTFINLPNFTQGAVSQISPNLQAAVSPGCLAPKGLHGRTTPFKVEVFGTKKANVNINGTDRTGNYVIYCSFVVKQGVPVFIELMWGNYTYLVARGSKTSGGNFKINTSDKTTMQVFKDKIRIGEYP